ncbi:MAG: type I glyceraldehyde-3-phosphate dehydrogenase [Candidatus Pacebacteria bacterium]|nr:type I glyceraldehyde-3-phosphate dehydrogenase [Candidatus Paceibacterota bacterium]
MIKTDKIRVAINGFGRIGRAFYKLALAEPQIEIVAVNDLSDIDNLNYLLKYDSAYGLSECKSLEKDIFYNEPDPQYLPWKELEVDIVVESTGAFNTYEKASAHIKAGAKKVVLSAPVKENKNPLEEKEISGPDIPEYNLKGKTVLMGINEDELKDCYISANGSCTTNAVSPVLQILNQKIGIEKALLNTIHSYTSTQRLVDSTNKKDFRKGRAAAQNIIPSTTGAAIATTLAIKELAGKFDGMSVRVPTLVGSLVDLTFITKRNVSVEELNSILKEATQDKRWDGIYNVTEDPIVSSDIIANPYAALVDLSLTKVVDGNLVKVLIWYDNEMGYTNTLIKHVLKTSESLN